MPLKAAPAALRRHPPRPRRRPTASRPPRPADAGALFAFLHGSGATAQSMIPLAFRFQSRFPSAALAAPSGFRAAEATRRCSPWFPMRGLNDDNRLSARTRCCRGWRTSVRREQARAGVPPSRTVLIGYSQGGTVALETAKTVPDLAHAVVAYSARFARLPHAGETIGSRIHLVHGAADTIVSRVHAERARACSALHVPVTLDIVESLGHGQPRGGLPGLAAAAAGPLRPPRRHAALSAPAMVQLPHSRSTSA